MVKKHVHEYFDIESCESAEKIREEVYGVVREMAEGVEETEKGFTYDDIDITALLLDFKERFEDKRDLLFAITVVLRNMVPDSKVRERNDR